MQTLMPKTILLVEDEVLIAMNVQMTLQKYGFMVLMANNGEKAVESVEKNPQIDLILMDINLGTGIDGTEAARRILETHDIPLIFHSSHTEPEVVEKTEGITSYGYIVKNSGETVLIASIRMAFRLWESEGKFRTAFEHVAVGMVLTSVKGELLRVNEAFSSMLGYTPQEIFSMNFISLTHPDDKELSLGKMKLLLESESDRSTFTKRYIHKDSHTVWTNVRVVLLRDSSGKPLHFIAHVEDITQRKEMEEALQRSIDQYDLLLKSIPVSIFIAQQGKYVYSNSYGARFLGYQTPEELVGVPIMDTIPESFQEVIRQRASRVEAGVGNEAMEMLLLRKDGNIIWSESTSIPFVYNNSQATMIIGRDITELRQTAIALAESKDRLESILKAVPTGIGVVLGTDRVLIDVNEKICAVFNEAVFLIFFPLCDIILKNTVPSINKHSGEMRNMKNVGTFWIILMVLNVTVPASGLDLQIQPVMGIPFGDDALQFATGAGGDAQLMFALPFAPVLSFGPSAGFYHLPVHDQYTTVSLFNGGAGGLLSIPLTSWFNLDFSVGGGYYYALLNDPSIGGGSGWFSAKAGFSFNLFDTIGLGVTGGYRSFLGMYQDAFASAAISLKLGTSGRAGVAKGKAPEPAVAVSQTAPAPVQASASASANGKIAISQVELGTVFPVFYAWYDNHPLGTVTITNSGTEAVENLKVSFFVESFMDNPKNSPSPTSLQPGESAEVPVFALFNNKMMEVSEGTKASYRVIIDYTVADQKKNEERVDTLSLYDRNSLAWDDDRKAAVFVTAKDQSVLSFAKNTAAMAPENEAVDGNLRTAMAVHEALRLYGMSYIVDPASSYTDLSKKESAVDYLQFPRQTLEYKSGDCDDLTILYCSLLESVNIETAFITIPGHIFMAFALETSPDESRKKYLKADDFIFLDGKTWVPLEITMTKEHFLRIWQEGTKEWLENSSREQAVLIPVRKAWGDYRPVGFPGSFSINLPAKAPVVEATAAEVTKFINREIASRVAQYQADINSSQGDPKTVNKLGVLYAKYGLYAEAAREFERAVAVREHAPSLLNLGNLAFHTGDFAKAYSWYSRVVALEPKNALAVLGMARVAHELENYGEVKNLYATLQTLNPDYARQFAYLDLRGAEATRAADMGQVKGLLIWGDE